MDITLKDTLAGIRQDLQEIATVQRGHGDLLQVLVEGQREIIKMLTPEAKDGPGLDEMLGHIIGQLTELTGYARQIAKTQSDMEQNMPGDVARAIASGAGAAGGANGSGRGNRT